MTAPNMTDAVKAKVNSFKALKESIRLQEIKRRLKAALRRKPRPAKVKEQDD